MTRLIHPSLVAAAVFVAGLSAQRSAEQDKFWESVLTLCGKAYEGKVVEAPAGDTTFGDKRLVLHVRECKDGVVRVPLHVGEDRSRTWVISRHAAGLRLKHDHRHEDGTEGSETQYGGDTAAPGTATHQEFPADAHTASLVPLAKTNVWTVELHPGRMFAYALRREGTDRRYRLEFDLTKPVAAPPPPWGAK